jgi:ABC-type dipeptide/oligopeptide/nickel transport system permease subunit
LRIRCWKTGRDILGVQLGRLISALDTIDTNVWPCTNCILECLYFLVSIQCIYTIGLSVFIWICYGNPNVNLELKVLPNIIYARVVRSRIAKLLRSRYISLKKLTKAQGWVLVDCP